MRGRASHLRITEMSLAPRLKCEDPLLLKPRIWRCLTFPRGSSCPGQPSMLRTVVTPFATNRLWPTALRTPLQPFIPLRQNDIANYRAPGAFKKGLLSRSISTLVRSNSSKITDGAMMDEGGVMPVELI